MDNRFSYYFKELRKSQGLTQEQIAEILGVSSQAISKWECGISYPDIEMLPIIANIFKVSTDYLLGVDVTKQEKEAINIYRRILNISKDSELVCKVTRDLVYCYYTLGDIPFF